MKRAAYMASALALYATGVAWAGGPVVIINNSGLMIPGQMQTGLKSSVPEANSVVSSPKEVRLTFTAPLDSTPNSCKLEVIDPYGNLVSEGGTSVSGEAMSVVLQPDLPAQQYKVRYAYTLYNANAYQSGAVPVQQRFYGSFKFTVQ